MVMATENDEIDINSERDSNENNKTIDEKMRELLGTIELKL